MSPRVRWGGLALTLALYGCALSMPAANVDAVAGPGRHTVTIEGHDLVAMGPKIPGAIAEGGLDADFFSFIVGWTANPLIALTAFAFLINRPRLAFLAGLAAIVLTLSVLPFWWSAVAAQPGYWCWVLSAAVGLISFRAARRPVLTEWRSDYGPPDVAPR